MRLTCIVGARPNFMKMAPILACAREFRDIQYRLVHTGQHYDARMSQLFFDELKLPEPDSFLEVGSGSHAVQTAKIMLRFDAELDAHPTDLTLVVGDVNSTIACALVAVKRGVAVGHVEAGLRSRDRRMPEEINRTLTDQVSDYLFTTERQAAGNLLAEGIPEERIYFVGNVMVDTLLYHRERARQTDILGRLGLSPRGYAACTIHRPSNVDTPQAAERTVLAIRLLADRLPVVFPVHPRTRNRWSDFGLWDQLESDRQVLLMEPLGYLEFLCLMDNAALVVTDSGGVQEESTVLGVPCLTFRENTERPITLTKGTNQLVGSDPGVVATAADTILAGGRRKRRLPELWDGRAAQRIIQVLRQNF